MSMDLGRGLLLPVVVSRMATSPGNDGRGDYRACSLAACIFGMQGGKSWAMDRSDPDDIGDCMVRPIGYAGLRRRAQGAERAAEAM